MWRSMTGHFFAGGPLAYVNFIERAVILAENNMGNDVAIQNRRKNVRVLELSTGRKLSLELCHPNDADPKKSYVSVISPLGLALFNANVGDMVEVNIVDPMI